MSERERQLDCEPEVDADGDVDVDALVEATDAETPETTGGLGERLRSRAGSILSGRALVYACVTALAGAVVAGGLLSVGLLGNLLGIFVVAFGYGAVTDSRRYAELGVAGGLLGGTLALFGNLVPSLLGAGVPLVAVGFVAGAVAGGLGHYFGRDLRAGLTRDL